MSEFARQLGINGSTCFNILKTLADHRLLSYDQDTRRYSLGTALIELASMVDDHGQLLTVALEHAERVAADVLQGCLVLRKAADSSFLVIGKAESPRDLKVTASVGDRFPANGAVLGKAWYAFASDEEVERMIAREGLPARSSRAITSYLDFKRELAAVRARGYSTSIGEYLEGHNAVGAAVMGPDGGPVLLLVVTGFASLIPPKRMPFIGTRLVHAVRAISRQVYGIPRTSHDPRSA
jgi:DNA-binding IclR family transcriptional regulator